MNPRDIAGERKKKKKKKCPEWVNASNKKTPSMHHPRRRNVTTLMVGLKNGHMNPRDIAGERKKKKKKNVLNG